ncbi:PepSY domain-containing protein [Niallia sp. 03133]|uniref:PepSY domain-containing protein n=1 Tax=Niallia sp. 03133 TaxID=3458060 RepID=UPI0040441F7F
MKKRKWLQLVFIILVVAIFLVISFVFFNKQDSLTKEQVKKIVASKYEGKISFIREKKQNAIDSYEAKLDNTKGEYLITIHAVTGNISNITVLSKKISKTQKRLTSEEAVKQLLLKYEGNVISVDQVTENGIDYFHIMLENNGTEKSFLVNKQTAELRIKNKEEIGTIKEETAKETALKEVSGTITDIDLEEEDNQLVYEIDIKTRQEKEVKIYINAYSGQVVSINWEED